MHPDPKKRPTCAELLENPLFTDPEKRDMTEQIKSLEEQVKKERTRNDSLSKILSEPVDLSKTKKPTLFRANTMY